VNEKRCFIVTYWQGGLFKLRVEAENMQQAIHVMQREGLQIRPEQLVSMRETATEDTITGLQRAVTDDDLVGG
jgi:hypothetical protein